jgi:hypothetical protein
MDMTNNKQQTAVKFYLDKIFDIIGDAILDKLSIEQINKIHDLSLQAKEMEKEQMRLDIEKKWEQYRIITNNEDAWSFKEWLIKQTYGGGER